MRNNFANELVRLAKSDDSIVLLSGDIGNKLFDNLRKLDEKKVINCGIAEQSMIGVAAGLASRGLKPVVYTITPFTTYRCFEQIRVDVCYNNQNVVIVGTGSGLSYATLGPTHQSLEDVAILRTLPNLTVLSPCDPGEVRLCLAAALENDGPVYIRLGKKGEPELYEKDSTAFEIGKTVNLREGNDICIVGTGSILGEAVKASSALADLNISVNIENFHTIKPINYDKLDSLFESFNKVIVLEEHGSIGGLYSAIVEYFAPKNLNCEIYSMGTADEFLHEIGDQQFARQFFGIDAKAIEVKVKAVLGKA